VGADDGVQHDHPEHLGVQQEVAQGCCEGAPAIARKCKMKLNEII
jgi:hypothetical protein